MRILWRVWVIWFFAVLKRNLINGSPILSTSGHVSSISKYTRISMNRSWMAQLTCQSLHVSAVYWLEAQRPIWGIRCRVLATADSPWFGALRPWTGGSVWVMLRRILWGKMGSVECRAVRLQASLRCLIIISHYFLGSIWVFGCHWKFAFALKIRYFLLALYRLLNLVGELRWLFNRLMIHIEAMQVSA